MFKPIARLAAKALRRPALVAAVLPVMLAFAPQATAKEPRGPFTPPVVQCFKAPCP